LLQPFVSWRVLAANNWPGGFYLTDLEGFLLGGYLSGGFYFTALEGLIWRVFLGGFFPYSFGGFFYSFGGF